MFFYLFWIFKILYWLSPNKITSAWSNKVDSDVRESLLSYWQQWFTECSCVIHFDNLHCENEFSNFILGLSLPKCYNISICWSQNSKLMSKIGINTGVNLSNWLVIVNNLNLKYVAKNTTRINLYAELVSRTC